MLSLCCSGSILGFICRTRTAWNLSVLSVMAQCACALVERCIKLLRGAWKQIRQFHLFLKNIYRMIADSGLLTILFSPKLCQSLIFCYVIMLYSDFQLLKNINQQLNCLTTDLKITLLHNSFDRKMQ